jgi:hypothetical protein
MIFMKAGKNPAFFYYQNMGKKYLLKNLLY